MIILITKLNQIIRGWANYHRHVVASETFGSVDTYVYDQLGSVAKISIGSECPIDLKIKQPESKRFPPGFGEDHFDFPFGLFESFGQAQCR